MRIVNNGPTGVFLSMIFNACAGLFAWCFGRFRMVFREFRIYRW